VRAAPPQRRPAVPPARCGRPAGAAPGQAERGAAPLALGRDRRLRMGEGSAAGVPWGTAAGQAAVKPQITANRRTQHGTSLANGDTVSVLALDQSLPIPPTTGIEQVTKTE
jgi:hypothetical protein